MNNPTGKSVLISNNGVEKCLYILQSELESSNSNNSNNTNNSDTNSDTSSDIVSNIIGCLRSLCLAPECQCKLLNIDSISIMLHLLALETPEEVEESRNIDNIIGILRVISMNMNQCSLVIHELYKHTNALTILIHSNTDEALVLIQLVIEAYPEAVYLIEQLKI